MRRMLAGLLAAALWLGLAAAMAEGTGTLTDPVPSQVAFEAEWLYPDAEIEDYAQVRTPEGTMGLLMLREGGVRRLLVYDVTEMENEERLYITEQALPQDDGIALLRADEEEPGFMMALIDPEHEEYWMKSVSFVWRDGDFHLTGFMDRRVGCESAAVSADHTLRYHSIDRDEEIGSVQGILLDALRYTDFEALPKTLEAAEKNADVPPGFCFFRGDWNTLFGKPVRFYAGRSFPVHEGPGERYPRSGGGKGAVGTNGWIQVFGQYDGWLLIQYRIDETRLRIGWIEASALPRGAAVPKLVLHDDWQEITQECALTDDPMGSGGAILQLKQGTAVRHAAFLGRDWELVAVTTQDGQTVWGFVPSECLTHG